MRGDTGSAGLLLVGGVLTAAAVAAAAGLVSGVLTHTRTEAAADMVALAAAGRLLVDPAPCEIATAVAADNDVDLAACEVVGLSISVTVAAELPPIIAMAVGDRRALASARAELVPRTSLS